MGDKMKIKELIKENLIGIIFVIIVYIICNIRLPYYILTSGGTIDVSNRIECSECKEFNGNINLLFVRQTVANIPTYLLSFVVPDWKREDMSESKYSDEDINEINFRNKIMLENSINSAKYVAFNELNLKIEESNTHFYVIGTLMDTTLKIGDDVLEVNGKKIDSLKSIKDEINKGNKGDILKVKIKRNKKEETIDVEIKEVKDEKVIGVIIVKNNEYTTDPNVKLNFKKSESGSSGGLMLTLSMYASLSNEDILRGRNIAGTGTISEDGSVGAIDGVKYKIMGAYNNKSDVVFVPRDNYKEAIKTVKEKKYDLEVVSVEKFSDVVDYLRKNNNEIRD